MPLFDLERLLDFDFDLVGVLAELLFGDPLFLFSLLSEIELNILIFSAASTVLPIDPIPNPID